MSKKQRIAELEALVAQQRAIIVAQQAEIDALKPKWPPYEIGEPMVWPKPGDPPFPQPTPWLEHRPRTSDPLPPLPYTTCGSTDKASSAVVDMRYMPIPTECFVV